MNKILTIFSVAILLFVAACNKEKTPIVESKETPIPECLQKGLPDLEVSIYNTKAIWREGGACGLKDNVEWKSFISASYSDYSKIPKEFVKLNFKNFTPAPKPVYNETSSIDKIPLIKGVYTITKYTSDGKGSNLICSTSGLMYRNDDAVYERYELDVRKQNTLEILSWNEQANEVYGIYTAHYILAGAGGSGLEDWSPQIVVKNCYFKAIVK